MSRLQPISYRPHSEQVRDQLRQLATMYGLSVSDVLRDAVQQYISEHKDEMKAVEAEYRAAIAAREALHLAAQAAREGA